MTTPGPAHHAPPEPGRPRVVVGVDGSPASVAALRWGRRTADALGLGIDAVTCWQYPSAYGNAGWDDSWRPDADAALLSATAVHEAFGHDQPAGLRTSVRQGHPVQVLLEEAVGAEVLVVGSRGHGGVAGLLLGSVSTGCAEHATCPVVVVHRPTTVEVP